MLLQRGRPRAALFSYPYLMLAVFVCCLLFQQPGPSQPAAAQPTAPTSAQPDLSSLSLPDLLKLLPDAENEFQWLPDNKEWVEWPASKELRKRIHRGDIPDDQWPALLKAGSVIAVPAKWPKGKPLAVWVIPPVWLGSIGKVEVTPRLPHARTTDHIVLYGGCGLYNDSERAARQYVEVSGPLAPGTQSVTFDVKITAPARLESEGGSPGRERRWRGTMTFPIQIVDTPSQALEPVRDPPFDEAVKGAVSVTIGQNGGTPPRTAMWINLQRTAAIAPFLDKHACRAKVELVDGPKVLDEIEVNLREGAEPPCFIAYYRDSLPQGQLQDQTLISRLRLRITGSADLAIRDLRRTSCWAGTAEGPLTEFLKK
jgi:hypothetical protein